jgi:hypothetical protein
MSNCPACAAATLPDARFCHACGVALGGQARPWLGTRWIALFAAVVASASAAGVLSIYFGGRDRALPPAMPRFESVAPSTGNSGGRDRAPQLAMPRFDGGAPSPGEPIDLSTLSPREAADRLFNRIMMAAERGDTDEAQRFAPMALAAYARLDVLDADARYHLGLIHAVNGDIEKIRSEIASLKQLVPQHLLAITLEHRVAELLRDQAAAARAYALFNAAFEAEMKIGRPEYADHRVTIEKFRAAGVRP